MKLEHVTQIRGNVSLSSKVKSTNILDGAYQSIFKGKSLNFQELREYNLGDNIKDIDWRASARSMNILVREYIAEKKHNILFILDSKYAMNANSNSNDLKRDIACDVSGTLAYLAYKNGDYTGAIYVKDDVPKLFSLKQTLYNIENFLTFYEEDLKNQNSKKKFNNSINDSLQYTISFLNKRAIIFIITDIVGLEEMDKDKLKTLSYRNDIMVINISDVNLYDTKSYDVEKRKYFSGMFLNNKKLAEIDRVEKEKVYNEVVNKLKKYKIVTVTISSRDEVIPKIIELLGAHSNIKNK